MSDDPEIDEITDRVQKYLDNSLAHQDIPASIAASGTAISIILMEVLKEVRSLSGMVQNAPRP
jgi:hypothetical protein